MMNPSKSFGIVRPFLWLALGTMFGAWGADTCWSTYYDWEKQNRQAAVPELVGLLQEAQAERASEASEVDRLRLEINDYRARYEVAQRELETRQDRRWVVTTMPATYTPPSDVISVMPNTSMRMGAGSILRWDAKDGFTAEAVR